MTILCTPISQVQINYKELLVYNKKTYLKREMKTILVKQQRTHVTFHFASISFVH
jgi:hypothetical protein